MQARHLPDGEADPEDELSWQSKDCVCVYVCVCYSLSHVQLFVTP